jgi:uncharacterized protein YjiS (DUF1127 family)
MAYHNTTRPISRDQAVLRLPARPRSFLHRIRAAFVALGVAMAQSRRTRQDQRHLSELTEYQLRDIGLRRSGHGRGSVFIRDDETEARFQ